jgi:hypothetical protein
MGMALPILERLAIRPRRRPTRNGDRLAPARIPSVLELEEPPSARAAHCVARGHQFDPQDESGQSSLGCASHPRGTAEARVRPVTSHGGQVHGPAPEAAVAELAHVSDEPHAELGLCRFLRGSYDQHSGFCLFL